MTGFRKWGALRALGTACALSLAFACGGDRPSASPGNPRFTLNLTCGSYNTGLGGEGITGVALAVAAVIDPPQPTGVQLEVAQDSRRVTATCPAGERLCFLWLPAVRGSASSNVSWNAGQGLQGATCLGDPDFLPVPEGRAGVSAGRILATWDPVPGASRYVATLRDLGPPGAGPQRILGRTGGSETHAEFDLPAGTPEVAVVEVEAWATDPEAFTGDAVPAGGARRSVRSFPIIGAPWALKVPSDYVGGALSLPVPAGSRMAVILLNLNWFDRAPASVQASGTGAAAARAAPGGAPAREAAAARVARRADPTPARALQGAAASQRTFCTFQAPSYLLWLGVPWQVPVRRPAVLLLETASALLYVDDEDVAGFTSSGLEELGRWWDQAVASVTSHSGPLPDVDGDGKFTLFFTSALGPRTWAFANVHDIWNPIEQDPDCQGTLRQSNGADMIHLHPPFGLEDDRGAPLPEEVQWAVVKGAMPYALQRMVDSARFGMDYPRANEITHARMSLAQTLAGSGNHVAALRALAGPAFLTRTGLGAGWGGYPTLKLFPYDTDTAGPHQELERAAADSFILFLADRLGPGFVSLFFEEIVGLRTLEVGSGLPFPVAYALWTGALLFSNEPASPWRGFDYTGVDWTPFHEKFQPFEPGLLGAGAAVPVTLRSNGFDVYVTGVAGPDGGTVTVRSAEAVRPHVVAIPFQGLLP